VISSFWQYFCSFTFFLEFSLFKFFSPIRIAKLGNSKTKKQVGCGGGGGGWGIIQLFKPKISPN